MPVSVPKPSQKSPNVFYFTSAPCRIGLSGLNVLKKNDKVGTEIAKNREIRWGAWGSRPPPSRLHVFKHAESQCAILRVGPYGLACKNETTALSLAIGSK